MADVAPAGVEKSLDDFFAKRDKKKKKEKVKGKEQATGGAVMAVKKTKREKEKSTKSENQDAQMEKEDEEWKDFEQKEVDYTGLRLQALQMSDEKEEEEYEEEVGEDGEIILVTGDKVSGPWNKSSGPPSAAPVEEVEVPEPKAPGVYRPPGARLTSTKRGPTQGPPEIFSDAQFPSLLSTARHVETRKDREMEKTFEVVKHKSRVREGEGPGSMQQLQLDNQYAILGDK
uniref:Carnitine deficiency-associated gene expressed in ventricle 3 n=1 Tax=Cyprinus carpio TaxID=7962 RepID=A0A8C1ZGC8_CYPCA